MIATGAVMSCGGVLWGFVALGLGATVQSLIPFGYVIATALNFAVLAKTKNFALARGIQTLLSIVLPFALQWGLGGLVASGATMLWSMLCLSAAQAFEDRASTGRWLILFVTLTLATLYTEYRRPPPLELFENEELLKIPLYLTTMNFLAVSLAIYALISIFMKLRRDTGMQLVQKTKEVAESHQALLQSEKMAALGRLSAGMAHELNNPAAAAARGAKHLRQSIRESWRTAIELGEIKLSQGQAALLAGLERRIEAQLTEPPSYTALERLDHERWIEDWCADQSVSGLPDASILLEAGLVPEVLNELASAFPSDMLPSILMLITGLYERESLAEQVTQGTERISLLVQTLKSYTYMDRAETQSTDVNAGLQDTLMMLRGELKHGVNVTRRFASDLPCIEANGGELNQVWTNLISNAADAMEGVGDLEITTRKSGDEIVVTIADSGPGIPPEVHKTLFDPFVTTKPVGKGTGLGLNISRSIVVDKHGGDISVSSQPGRTKFTIRLPLVEAECPPEIKR